MVKVSTTGGVEATFEDWAWKCEDDLLLALPLFGREGRMHHGVAEDIECAVPRLGRQRDVEDGAILRGVGVDLAAEVAGLPHDVARRARRCTFENHVLDEMRETGAEKFIFVYSAGANPNLHRRHRRTVVFFDQQNHAVIQHHAAQVRVGTFEYFQSVQGFTSDYGQT